MKLLLFDIDYTLLMPSKGHHEAFVQGFQEVFGVEMTLDLIDCSGMTDRQIIFEAMRRKRIPEKVIQAHADECTRVIEKAYAKKLMADDLVVMNGAREILEALSREPSISMGLVTGNLETIAWGKMRKVGLAHYFKCGGFGDESLIRADLVKKAVEQATNRYGTLYPNNIYVLGDTPRDIVASKEGKAVSIGVATGKYPKQELKRAGADWVISDFTEKDKLFNILELDS